MSALRRVFLLLVLAAVLLVAARELATRAWDSYLGSALSAAEWRISPGGPPSAILADEPAHPHWRW